MSVFLSEDKHPSTLSNTFTCLKSSNQQLLAYLLLKFHLAGHVALRWEKVTFANIGFEHNNEVSLVPSLLKSYTLDVDDLDHADIIFSFSDEFLPKSVFHQFLTAVVDLCHREGYKIKK